MLYEDTFLKISGYGDVILGNTVLESAVFHCAVEDYGDFLVIVRII